MMMMTLVIIAMLMKTMMTIVMIDDYNGHVGGDHDDRGGDDNDKGEDDDNSNNVLGLGQAVTSCVSCVKLRGLPVRPVSHGTMFLKSSFWS